MSNVIDNRIVNMRFNNKEFEKNAQQSTKTLEKLKAALNFKGLERSFDGIISASRNLTFSTLNNSVATVSGSFSVLEQVAIGALRRIGDQAVNAGERLIKSLTIEQIQSGFAKYEEEVGSVQTIMAATGKTVDEVQGYLDKLMWYTDETSYSFSDMASNIGKFTSAGVDLGDATEAMMGISNWAAISGQGISQASHAMYNLSQAMGSGAVKLIDWKSIELANMATAEFKQQVLDTAVGVGTLKRVGDGLYETTKGTTVSVTKFNDSLQDQWFTSDVLVKVLKRYNEYAERVYELTQSQGLTAAEAMEVIGSSFTGYGEKAFRAAQEAKTFTDALNATKDAVSTGWLKSFELIAGNYEEAKVLWTDLANALYDIFAEPGNYRNEQFEIWATDMRGRARLLRGLYSIFDSFTVYLNKFHDAFADVFGQWDAKTLSKITTGINKLANEFEATGQKATQFYMIVKRVFNTVKLSGQAVIDVLKTAGKGAKDAFFNVFKREVKAFNLQDTLKKASLSIIAFVRRLADIITEGNKLYRIFRGLFSALHIIKTVANEVFKAVFPGVKSATNTLLPLLLELLAKIADKITLFDKKNRIGQLIANIKALPAPLELARIAFEKLNSVVTRFKDGFKKATNIDLDEVYKKLKSRLDSIRDAFTEFKDSLPKPSIGNIFETIGKVMGGVVAVVKKIAPGVLKAADLIGQAFGKLWDAIANSAAEGDFSSILSLLEGGGIAGLITSISVFVSKLSNVVDSKAGLTGLIANINGVLESAQNALNDFSKKTDAELLRSIAISIAILVGSLLVLSLIDQGKLAGAIYSITMMFGELVGSFAAILKISDTGGGIKLSTIALAMISLAAAILILSVSLKIISTIELGSLNASMLALTILLGEMVVAATFLSKGKTPESLILASVGLKQFAKALLVFVKVVKQLGSLDTDTLAQGLISTVSLMGAITGMMLLLQNTKFSPAIGIGIIFLAVALNIMAAAVEKLGMLDSGTITKGMYAVVIALTAISLALIAIPDNALAKSLGIVVAAGALYILAQALKVIADIDTSSMFVSLFVFAILLTEIAVALEFLNEGLPGALAMLIISASFLVLAGALKVLSSLSWAEVILALTAITAVIAIMGVAAVALGPVAPVLMMIAGAVALMGWSMMMVAGAMLMFSVALATLAVSGVAGATALVSIIAIIGSALPLMVSLLGRYLVSVIALLKTLVPAIADLIVSVVKSLLEGLQDLVPVAIETILLIIDALLKSLSEHWPSIVDSLISLWIGMFDTLRERLPELLDSALNFVIAFMEGLGELFEKNGGRVGEAFKKLITGFFHGAFDFVKAIGAFPLKLITKLAAGIWSFKDKVWDKISETITSAIEKLKTLHQKFVDAGSDVISGIVEGIKAMMNKPGELLEQIGANLPDGFKHALGIASPSKVMASISKWIPEGIAAGIESNGKTAINAVDKMGLGVVESFAKYSALAADAAADEYFSQPTIRPVVDMSAVMGASGSVNGFFATQSMSLSGINGTLEAQGADLREQMNQNRIYNDSNVLASMAGLRSDINTLAGAMSEMQVVMDTGATVGALAPGMDKALGVRANLKGRRN